MARTFAKVDGTLVVTDHPVAHWLFDGCFVAAGFVALHLSYSDASNPWASALGVVVGLGNIAGGLIMIAREPASRVVVDPAAARIRITRVGLAGKRVEDYALGELDSVGIESTEHTDGGKVYRPRLRFTSSRDIPVTYSWYQREGPCMAIVRALRDFTKR